MWGGWPSTAKYMRKSQHHRTSASTTYDSCGLEGKTPRFAAGKLCCSAVARSYDHRFHGESGKPRHVRALLWRAKAASVLF